MVNDEVSMSDETLTEQDSSEDKDSKGTQMRQIYTSHAQIDTLSLIRSTTRSVGIQCNLKSKKKHISTQTKEFECLKCSAELKATQKSKNR